jgi:hypothetical protein
MISRLLAQEWRGKRGSNTGEGLFRFSDSSLLVSDSELLDENIGRSDKRLKELLENSKVGMILLKSLANLSSNQEVSADPVLVLPNMTLEPGLLSNTPSISSSDDTEYGSRDLKEVVASSPHLMG